MKWKRRKIKLTDPVTYIGNLLGKEPYALIKIKESSDGNHILYEIDSDTYSTEVLIKKLTKEKRKEEKPLDSIRYIRLY